MEKMEELEAHVRELTLSRDRLSAQEKELPLTTQCMLELANEQRSLREQVCHLNAEVVNRDTASERPVRGKKAGADASAAAGEVFALRVRVVSLNKADEALRVKVAGYVAAVGQIDRVSDKMVAV